MFLEPAENHFKEDIAGRTFKQILNKMINNGLFTISAHNDKYVNHISLSKNTLNVE